MKSLISGTIIAFIALFLVLFYFTNLEKVPAGEEMVEISQPYMFGDGGVKPHPYPAGRHFIWPSSSVVRYNIKPIKHREVFEDITASDNVPIDFSTTFVFLQVPGKTPRLHEKFGQDWYIQKVKAKLRTITRNHARGQSSIKLRTDQVTIEKCQEDIKGVANAFLKKAGVDVMLQQVQIGHVNPPDELLTEAAKTAAQKQRKKTQGAREQAEISRKKAEMASAAADQEYMKKMGMTPEQYLVAKRLELTEKQIGIMEIVAKKGGGNFNVWMTDGGDTTPKPVIPVQ